MQYLMDVVAHKVAVDELVRGQLLTPLTRYAIGEHPFGIDNGAFTRFDSAAFTRLLDRAQPHRDRCLFVAMPDVVGNGRRTLEVFGDWADRCAAWPVALVAQDGIEGLDIPWSQFAAIFIGGSTGWKMSQAAADICKAAIIANKHIHVGRVNTPARYAHFQRLGAHTCDGSGVSRFSWMLDRIRRGDTQGTPLLHSMADMHEIDT